MDVRNCKDCGKMFNYIGGAPLCEACKTKLEDKFVQVKQYIYDNPSAGIAQVAEENEVTTSQIKRWIREERLSFSENSAIGLECESCGTLIKTGRFCGSCRDKMANRLGNAYQKPKIEKPKKKEKESPKMRFLDS